SHVRSLSRTVDGEIAQRDDFEFGARRVCAGEVLAGELADAVRRGRIRRRLLGNWVTGRFAVDRRGGGEDDALPGCGRGLEHALARTQVVPRVRGEVFAPAAA